VAFTRLGQQIGLVDASGVLLTMPPATMAQRHYSFPVVTGIDPGDPLASRTVRMAVYQRLLTELDGNNQHLSEQISEIDLTDPEDARVLMPEQGADILAHFGEDHFLERYQRYKAHIAAWRQQYPKLAAVDLRYEQQVVLEMAHGQNAIEAAPGGNTAADSGNAKPSAGELAHKVRPSLAGASLTPASAPVAKPAGKASTGQKALLAKEKAARDKAAKEKAAKDKLIRELTAKDKAARDKRKREAAAAQRAAGNGNKDNSAQPTRLPAVA
jgi:cell division protein FtsQ